MYAIFISNNKQYLAENNKIIYIDKINTDKSKYIEFKNIILLSKDDKIITNIDLLSKIKIIAYIINHIRNKKLKILKFKRRKRILKIYNHRQWFTKIKILNIL